MSEKGGSSKEEVYWYRKPFGFDIIGAVGLRPVPRPIDIPSTSQGK